MSALYDISVALIDGTPVSMSTFRGKTLLIVNVASECGLTPQYNQLEQLYKKHQHAGFEVLGFPCNQFGGQEPGTESAIEEFCRGTFGVQFPMFSKIEVNGPGRHPLYQYLIDKQPKAIQKGDGKLKTKLKEKGLLPGPDDAISWNFEKFLVDAEGHVVARFAPDVEVLDPAFHDVLANALNNNH